MRANFRLAAAAVVAATAAHAVPSEDEITRLPGWDYELPSKWYSGYVDISSTMGMGMQSHYVFVESEGTPATDPVILWSNGGPGASSMFGLVAELGPLLLNDESLKGPAYLASGVPTLFYNPSSWTQAGNLLLFDWPPPVGFSYCNDVPAGDGFSCGAWNDTRAAQAEYAALRGWFDDKFPEYKANDLYLTGESYAGVYIPKLAQEVIDANAKAAKLDPLPLKGFAVGDACVGTEVLCGGDTGMGPWWSVVFFYGHGQFSSKLFDELTEECTVEGLQTGAGLSDKCNELLGQMDAEVGGYYDYNLYDDCIYEDDIRRRLLSPGRNNHTDAAEGWSPRAAFDRTVARLNGGALNDYACGGGAVQEVWVTNAEVMAALHVPDGAAFVSADNGVGMEYDLTEKNLMPFYTDVASNHPEIRVLVYNGDTDPGINSFVSQNWTVALGLEETEAWRPWTLDGCQRMGGYVTSYRGDVQFLTIRGSGHMVPQFKPEAALELITRWIKNEPFQPYNASCTAPPAVPAARRASVSAASKRSELSSVEAQIAALQAKAGALRKDLAD